MNLLNELAVGKIIEFEDGIRRTIIKKLPHQDIKNAYYYEFDDGLCERDVRIHGKIVSNLVEPQVSQDFCDLVAHIVIKNKLAHSQLIELCTKWHNEMYIDFEQSYLSYKNESKNSG